MKRPQPPILSVVVPFYNVEAYFPFLLESLRSQAVTDAEFLLVADEPTDNSLAIAHAAAAADSRFIVLETSHGGPGPARNLGVQQARGAFLAFADADDAVTRTGYHVMVSTLLRTGSSFATANALRFNDDLKWWQSWTHRKAFAVNRLRTHINEVPHLVNDRMTTSKVFRRDFWLEVGLHYPTRLYEDLPVAMRAHVYAEAVDVIRDYCYLWRERQTHDSITQTIHSIENAQDRARSVLEVLEIASGCSPTARLSLAGNIADVDIPALLTVPEDRRSPRLADDINRLESQLSAILGSSIRSDVQKTPDAADPALPEVDLWVDEDSGTVEVHPSDPRWRVRALHLLDAGRKDRLRIWNFPESAACHDHVVALAAHDILESANGEHCALRAAVVSLDGSTEQVVDIGAGRLPYATEWGAHFMAWGVFATGTIELQRVLPEQTARFSIERGRLVVEPSRAQPNSVIELRYPHGMQAARAKLSNGRAVFNLDAPETHARPDDSVRQRAEWLVMLDEAGDCRQLHPTNLAGEARALGARVHFTRIAQGAVQLAFSW